ncbi:hypothetical protein [Hydrogenimonas thermophila]|uniref:Uncharacterized protein n=1 Tax=Hydrogenimonas thermophila TaxID=223786 RepID=A0A1I5U5U4_9BACT|nr:hypothetical protein [Hydrogenimonas thermophila]WOE68856.1 hypothetical protein RZR91_07005 [Hydrogenimonas thermophila]WOE71364.1 hypothetical protein RZR97_06975 [Hydrogenimonas thermophila]SFP90629.1 hypothetical protein SAMN05216234_15511 [Hydrogenimonas thermophila]
MPDILETIKAIHTQEERYSKLELIYNNSNEKEKIYSALKELTYRKECQVEISDNEEGKNRGFVCIEFHDDYDKESGPFFDALISKLGINRCQ